MRNTPVSTTHLFFKTSALQVMSIVFCFTAVWSQWTQCGSRKRQQTTEEKYLGERNTFITPTLPSIIVLPCCPALSSQIWAFLTYLLCKVIRKVASCIFILNNNRIKESFKLNPQTGFSVHSLDPSSCYTVLLEVTPEPGQWCTDLWRHTHRTWMDEGIWEMPKSQQRGANAQLNSLLRFRC